MIVQPSPGPERPTSPVGRGGSARAIHQTHHHLPFFAGEVGLSGPGRGRACKSRQRPALRQGQALVEFAIIALVLYMLLAAILTFGHMLYVAQGLQSAADLAAREISRTPLPADATFEDVLTTPEVQGIYSDDFLVYDLNDLGSQNFFFDVVPTWPLLNQQLATLMIVDRPDFDGDGQPDANLIRYPGALVADANTPSGYTVAIPLIDGRDGSGFETIRWVPVVEEIEPRDPEHERHDPFRVSNEVTRGIVALRINYPFQSPAMSSFRPNPGGPFEPTIGFPNAANDDEVVNEINSPDGLLNIPLQSGNRYVGTYGGRYGLGAQGAFGRVDEITGGHPVRPYRRVISAQAIYRREVFSN